VRLCAAWVAARQRHHVGVVVLVEKKKTEVKSVADLEIGSAATPAVPALYGDQAQNSLPVVGDQADQFRSHFGVVSH
jgi:hypothetical protein